MRDSTRHSTSHAGNIHAGLGMSSQAPSQFYLHQHDVFSVTSFPRESTQCSHKYAHMQERSAACCDTQNLDSSPIQHKAFAYAHALVKLTSNLNTTCNIGPKLHLVSDVGPSVYKQSGVVVKLHACPTMLGTAERKRNGILLGSSTDVYPSLILVAVHLCQSAFELRSGSAALGHALHDRYNKST